jgi:hypothetical protein
MEALMGQLLKETHPKWIIPFFLAALLFHGCMKDVDVSGPVNDPGTFSESTDYRSLQKTIGPQGGVLEFGDGTILNFPANSLKDQTTVTLSRPKGTLPMSQSGVDFLRIEPDGLTLDVPATLRLPYQSFQNVPDKRIAVYSTGGSNVRSSNTVYPEKWERLPISSINSSQKFVEVQVRHFSFFSTIFDRPLDLILGIPGKYLQKCDLIYCLAETQANNGWHWFPGHAAMFLGVATGNLTTNDGSTIIESSPPDGVKLWTLSGFKDASYHLYMGARRYNGSISSSEATSIATYAIDKKGKGYSLIGEGNIFNNKYSCVGLTEASYDEGGKSIIPGILEFPFILPLEQYIRTIPVDAINVQAGEEIVIPVKGVVWDATNSTYTDAPGKFTATATGLPSGATFTNNTFRWIPASSHSGTSYPVSFKVDATSDDVAYSSTQSLAIKVDAGQLNLPPDQPVAPFPSNGATIQQTAVTLQWSCSDPDSDPLTYDVYFGTSSSPPRVAQGRSITSYASPSLSQGTTYYWQIVAFDDHSHQTAGPVWKFSTASNTPPLSPSNPNPSDNASIQSSSTTLGWSSSDPDGDALTYDVYFGTSSSPPMVASNRSSLTYPVSGLTANVPYYWKITAKDSRGGVTDGPAWKFSYVPAVTTGITGIVKDAVTRNPISSVGVAAYQGSTQVASGYTTVNGTFELAVAAGSGYRVVFSKTGYLTATYQNISVSSGSKTVLETVLQIDDTHGGTGSVSGTVRHAVTNAGVSGLTLQARAGINVQTGTVVKSTTTSSSGTYSLTGLSAGHYTIEAGGTGYNTTYFTVVCVGGISTSGQDAVISPAIPPGETRIVLTWTSTPADIDAHLTGPEADGSRFHIYFWVDTAPNANLDRDDTDGYGPETITVTEQLAGIYRYSVHDYSNRGLSSSNALSNSQAQVRVYRGSTLTATFNIPQNTPGTLWTVFEMIGSTITPVNSMTYVTDPEAVTKRATNQEDPSLFRNLPQKSPKARERR